MGQHRFRQVDVFGSGPVSGNPVAVVLDAQDLTTQEMQRVSAWTNLSECTFVLPPTEAGADYRVRIFSLATELPFAGHPTLGTAHAWLDAGGTPRTEGVVVQECGAGLVPVRHEREREALAFAAPPLVREGVLSPDEHADVLAVLGLTDDDVEEARWIDNGPGWVGVLLRDADAVAAIEPRLAAVPGPWAIGVAGLRPPGDDVALEVRAFFREGSAPAIEDPVTGSLNASLAQWMLRSGRLRAPYVAAQGAAVGRAGRVHVTRDGDGVWVGGATQVVVSGTITL